MSRANLLVLKKDEIRPLVGLLTGHGPAKNHPLRIGCVQDDVCRFYFEEIESAEHIFLDCDALGRSTWEGMAGSKEDNGVTADQVVKNTVMIYSLDLLIFSH